MKHFGLKKQKRTSIFFRRAIFTILIIAIYLLGRHILLPGYNGNTGFSQITEQNPLAYLYSLAGVDVSQISMFSLGLGPWITTMIVWQVINLNKSWNIQSWSLKKADFVQKILTLIFSVLQGIAVMYTARSENGRFLLLVDDWIYNMAVLATVVAGSFVIIWLAGLNVSKGVGGQTIIIISGILLQFANQLVVLIGQSVLSKEGLAFLVGAAISFLLLGYIAVVCERAEIRVIMLLQLVLDWFGHGFTKNFGSLFDFTKPLSLAFYLLAIYLLAILFAYINLEPEETAKRLQRQGEYLDYIQPGKATLKVLKHYISLQSNVGALYLIVFIGLPYFINFFLPLPNLLLTIPSTLIILVSMLLPLHEEIRILRIGTYYHKELEFKGE